MENIDRIGNRIKRKEFIRQNKESFDQVLVLPEKKNYKAYWSPNTPEGKKLISEIREHFGYSEKTVDIDVLGAFYKSYEKHSKRSKSDPCVFHKFSAPKPQPITPNKKKQFAINFLTTLAKFENNLDKLITLHERRITE